MVRNLIMNYNYTATFSSILKPLVSEEKDKYLALASLMEVGNFIPNIDTEKNVDLLPVAFNAAVNVGGIAIIAAPVAVAFSPDSLFFLPSSFPTSVDFFLPFQIICVRVLSAVKVNLLAF